MSTVRICNTRLHIPTCRGYGVLVFLGSNMLAMFYLKKKGVGGEGKKTSCCMQKADPTVANAGQSGALPDNIGLLFN